VARPAAIHRSGHGAWIWLSGVSQRRGSQLAHQGRRPVRPLQPTRLTTIVAGTWRATASARPTAWASMPARPSEIAQMTIGSRAGAFREPAA
jgi:hypothetical protein